MMVPMPPISEISANFTPMSGSENRRRRIEHAHIHGEQPAADAGEERGERHTLQLDLEHVDAGGARRVLVGAHRKQIVAEPRAAQPDGDQHDDRS